MKISELCKINPSPTIVINDCEAIDYIDTSSVVNGHLESIQHLTRDFPSRAQREVLSGDILISSVRPNLRHNYYVQQWDNGKVASSGFIHIRVSSPSIDSRFLYYFLTSPSQVSRYVRIADSSQSAYPSFNKDVIEKIDFPNIDLPTQLRIAGIMA